MTVHTHTHMRAQASAREMIEYSFFHRAEDEHSRIARNTKVV
jgi:hypothetical protein